MGLATLHESLRAAFRERLLTLVDIDHAPGVSVTLAQANGKGVFTRASGSWLAAGLARGMELSITGFGAAKVAQVLAVTAEALTTDAAGAATAAGGGRFVAALPQGRAWQGETDFVPSDAAPYVGEALTVISERNLSVGNGDGTGGTIETRLLASATFFYPLGAGTRALGRMAGAAAALFRPGLSLARDGDSAVVENVERSSLYRDGGRLACAVSARLLAFTQS